MINDPAAPRGPSRRSMLIAASAAPAAALTGREAFAAGRIVNPTTARSQLMGGMIWGISSALHEATEIDPAAARYVNTNLADYLVPVNADIGEVEVILVPDEDRAVNDLGIKGIGEIGIVGTSAAICNAIHHATGRRLRHLPVRLGALL